MGICSSSPERKPQGSAQSGQELKQALVRNAPPPAGGGGGGGTRSATFGLPSERFGSVIGRGGETIKRLQGTHGVNITLPPRGQAGDYIVIEGPAAAVQRCKEEVEALTHFRMAEGSLQTCELDIPPHKFGALIGPQGSTLKRIEQEAKVDVKVPRRGAPDSEKATVSGVPEALQAALRLIREETGLDVKATAVGNSAVSFVDAGVKANLSGNVQRALFFPERDEPEGVKTLEVFLRYLRAPQRSLDVCIFALTNDQISDTIMVCHRRGVKVRVICDNDQANAQGADIGKLRTAGIEVREDKTHFHMHNKFCILDGMVLMNGSFNWTVQAQTSNNENVMITSDKFFVSEFCKYYEQLWREMA